MMGELLNLARQQHVFDDWWSIQDKSEDQTLCWSFNLLTCPVDVSSVSRQISYQNSALALHVALIDAEDQTGQVKEV